MASELVIQKWFDQDLPAPSSAATFGATASSLTTVAAALATVIQLAATAGLGVRVSDALSTGINLTSAPSAQVQVAPALTTGLNLVGAASAAATVSPALSSGINLACGAAGQAQVSPGLVTGINLSASVAGLISLSPNLFSLQGMGNALVSLNADLTTFPASGGSIGYLSQPGPGIGPFSNTQFQAAPRAAITPGPQFLMAATVSPPVLVSAVLSGLQSWAANPAGWASVSADLTTQVSSGGRIAYLSQPGPGVGPFSNNQFQAAPRSTNSPFQQLQGAGSAGAVASISAALATGVSMAAQVPGQASVTPALTSGINLAATASAVVAAPSALSSGITMAASPSLQVQASPALLTGLTLAANVASLTYLSGAFGAGAQLAVTAAGLVGVSADLLTAISMAASPTGTVLTSADLGGGALLIAQSGGNASMAASLTTSLLMAAQAVGVTTVSAAPVTGTQLVGTVPGAVSVQAALTGGISLAASSSAFTSLSSNLTTQASAWAGTASSTCSITAALLSGSALTAGAGAQTSITARLLTVLQPPGEFADIRWLRAPRGGGVPYTEFFQGIGEKLWYAVNWEDWLASNWEPNSSATLGQALRPTVPNGLEFVCTAIGQTGATEPLWPTYAGGVVIDGTAIWQGQPVSTASFDDTISGSAFSAPAGVLLDSGQVLSQRSYLIIDTTSCVVGTDYDVLCTIDTAGGQQKIAKLRIKVR